MDDKENNEFSKHIKVIKINKIRMHYFFSEIWALEDIFKMIKIKIQVTNLENKLLYFGELYPLSHFTPFNVKKNSSGAENFKIIMFSNSMNICKLNCSAGISFDKKVDTTLFNLFRYEDSAIFYTDNYFFNSFALPDSWIEVISNFNSEIQDNSNTTKHKLNVTRSTNNIDILKYQQLITVKESKLYKFSKFKVIYGIP